MKCVVYICDECKVNKLELDWVNNGYPELECNILKSWGWLDKYISFNKYHFCPKCKEKYETNI
jgi:hypothetical protein